MAGATGNQPRISVATPSLNQVELYEREAGQLYARFVAGSGQTSLARARLIHLIGAGKRKFVGDVLGKVGILPWYRHPRVLFDFDRRAWVPR
jgi:hypothetical protein